MSDITIIGGASPLGHHVLTHLAAETDGPLRVLVHRRRVAPDHVARARIVEVPGDLRKPETIAPALVRDGTVINLAVLSSLGDTAACDHGVAMTQLARACATAGVARMVHCSSVSIVGRTPVRLVFEDTPCDPRTPYERAKLADEHALIREAHGRFHLAIARPTAILGTGLSSLVSLGEALLTGSRVANYLRSTLLARSPTHLVCAENVAAALLFLARREAGAEVDTFIVSEDDDPTNTFAEVERRLRSALLVDDDGLPRLPLPRIVHRSLLWARGRRSIDPARIYDGSRLLTAGFARVTTLDATIARFGAWYRVEGQRRRLDASAPRASHPRVDPS